MKSAILVEAELSPTRSVCSGRITWRSCCSVYRFVILSSASCDFTYAKLLFVAKRFDCALAPDFVRKPAEDSRDRLEHCKCDDVSDRTFADISNCGLQIIWFTVKVERFLPVADPFRVWVVVAVSPFPQRVSSCFQVTLEK